MGFVSAVSHRTDTQPTRNRHSTNAQLTRDAAQLAVLLPPGVAEGDQFIVDVPDRLAPQPAPLAAMRMERRPCYPPMLAIYLCYL